MASFTLSAFLCVAVLSSITLGAKPDFPSAPCPKGWVHNNKRCYLYFPEKRSWIDAEMHCVSFGGNLASERTADEHSFLKKLHMPDGDKLAFWIGLSDVHKKGTWIWSDGTKMDFKKWNSGEPKSSGGNEDCVLSNSDGTDWQVSDCAKSYPYICSLRWR
ncbi:hypothetical protein SKAU_G00382550 [Synaphobranchus kaupii]|uniref:C-type lectin domain-containing protein n=1 Tax=Synaphobranchus kaupii TaxID=118154 RepID=A0A9Q1IDZ3_SYNKA|nr:hypothetical protein SKAU_G00382550 [Synaphobranchus kaupii]